jgi:hypothetical protein
MKSTILILGMLLAVAYSCFANGTNEIVLTGTQIDACSRAFTNFKATETNADVSHYTVIVSQQASNVVLIFVPDGLPRGIRGGGHTKYGSQVEYLVSTDSGRVVSKSYSR